MSAAHAINDIPPPPDEIVVNPDNEEDEDVSSLDEHFDEWLQGDSRNSTSDDSPPEQRAEERRKGKKARKKATRQKHKASVPRATLTRRSPAPSASQTSSQRTSPLAPSPLAHDGARRAGERRGLRKARQSDDDVRLSISSGEEDDDDDDGDDAELLGVRSGGLERYGSQDALSRRGREEQRRQRLRDSHNKEKRRLILTIAGIVFVVGSLSTMVVLLTTDGSDGDAGKSVYAAYERSLRPAYHARPKLHWINDPNGPVFYKGLYHLFFQYNPNASVWGDMHWGHLCSEDLVNWRELPVALAPDEPYDEGGVFSGSILVSPSDGIPRLLYTGVSVPLTPPLNQTQNLALPVDPADPELKEWTKYSANPLLLDSQVPGRDPTSPWYSAEQDAWFMAIGDVYEENGTRYGRITLAKSKTDKFTDWTVVDTPLYEGHAWPELPAAENGLWECPDFYPLHTDGKGEADAGTRWVLKISRMKQPRHDYYSIGTYNETSQTFEPDDRSPTEDFNKFVDYGTSVYASKSFLDTSTQRQIWIGWIDEEDSVDAYRLRDWAGAMSLPRELQLDSNAPDVVFMPPIGEVVNLRHPKWAMQLDGWKVRGKSKLPLAGHSIPGDQFELETLVNLGEVSSPAATSLAVRLERGSAEWFALTIRRNAQDSGWELYIERDHASLASGTKKTSMTVPFAPYANDLLELRLFVDHSVVEVFTSGGYAAAAFRVYPTKLHTTQTVSLVLAGEAELEVSRLRVFAMFPLANP